MNVAELLDAAKRKQGTLGKVAELLEVRQTTLSEWRTGKYKPEASKIAQLAELAGLPVLVTVADVEAQLHPEASAVWQRALGKMKAAGVTATVMVLVGSALTTAHDVYAGLCIM